MSPVPRPSAVAATGEALKAVATGLAGSLAYVFRRRPRGRRPRVRLAGALEAAALLAVCAAAVAFAVVALDPAIPSLRLYLPEWLVVISDRLTDLGYSGLLLWPAGIAIAYLLALMPQLAARGDAMGRRVAASVLARIGFVFLSVGVVGLAISIIKHAIGRARPLTAYFIDVPEPHLTFDVMVWKSGYASFPSGHTTTAFAAAVALGALFPRARWPLMGLAAVVGVTRILLGSHYPSDVIAGAALGSLFALAMVKAFAARRLVFKVDADGRVRPMAGPSVRRLGALRPPPRLPGPAPEADPTRSLQEARP